MPWKIPHDVKLCKNERLVRKCQEKINSKLNKDLSLKCDYQKVFQSYKNEGIIEPVPECELNTTNPVQYMTHRPVVKEGSETTKVRPVFNASFPSYDGV